MQRQQQQKQGFNWVNLWQSIDVRNDLLIIFKLLLQSMYHTHLLQYLTKCNAIQYFFSIAGSTRTFKSSQYLSLCPNTIRFSYKHNWYLHQLVLNLKWVIIAQTQKWTWTPSPLTFVHHVPTMLYAGLPTVFLFFYVNPHETNILWYVWMDEKKIGRK